MPGDCLFSSEGLFGWWTIIPGFPVRRFWLDSDNHLCNSDLRFDTSLVGTAVWPDYCSHFLFFISVVETLSELSTEGPAEFCNFWTSSLKRREGRSWGCVWMSPSLFSSRSLWRVFQKPTRVTDISALAVRFHLQRSAPVWNVFLFVCLFVVAVKHEMIMLTAWYLKHMGVIECSFLNWGGWGWRDLRNA